MNNKENQIIQTAKKQFGNGNPFEALKTIQKSTFKTIPILSSEAMILTSLGKFKEANEIIEKNIKLLSQLELSKIYLMNSIINKKFKIDDNIINILIKHNDRHLNEYLSVIYCENKDYTKSLFYSNLNKKIIAQEAINAKAISLSYLNSTIELSEYLEELEKEPEKASLAYGKAGETYLQRKEWITARKFFEKSNCLNTSIDAEYGLACISNELGEYEAALLIFNKIVKENHEKYNWSTHINLGTINSKLERNDKALEHFKKAAEIDKTNPLGFYNTGMMYAKAHDWKNASIYNKKAIEISPNYAPAKLHQFKIDRRMFEDTQKVNEEILQQYKKTGETLYAHLDYYWINGSPEGQYEYAKKYHFNQINQQIINAKLKEETLDKQKFSIKSIQNKIHIAFVTPDLHPNHPVGRLTIRLDDRLSELNVKRTVVNTLPFPYPKSWDPIKNSFDNWIDIYKFEDEKPKRINNYNKIMNEINPDLIIDLSGYTSNTLREIFYLTKDKIPIVSAFGFPGTTGGIADYVWGDEYLIEAKNKKFYTEKIIYSKYCHLPVIREAPLVVENPKEKYFNLNKNNFVFACFNDFYKIDSDLFKLWMSILEKCKNSYLILREPDLEIKNKIKYLCNEYDINTNRLIFYKKKESRKEYLSQFAGVDCFLDTRNYSAGSIAVECVSYCVPLITFEGESWISRMAGSINTHIKMSQNIAKTDKEYIDKAIEIYLNYDYRITLKKQLFERFSPQVDKEMSIEYARDFISKLKGII
jgi:protein O-GlcNAc transferase